MDLGIKGRTALICGASKGLGKACAEALAGEGVNIVLNARTAETLEKTAADLRARFPVRIDAVASDIASEAGRRDMLAACPAPDILINNAGGSPVGDWRSFSHEQWLAALEGNMMAAIMLIRAVADGMAERRFGRIVNITSVVVKQPHPALALSVGARVGLTGVVKTIASGYVASNVTINNLLPTRFDTERFRATALEIATMAGRSFDEEMKIAAASAPAGRIGTLEEFGSVCAFYCSTHVGYITGQNVLLDGGSYPGLL